MLFTIFKVLFFGLLIFYVVTFVTALVRRGKKYQNTEWPYSYLNSFRFCWIGKHLEKNEWKFSDREAIGWLVVFMLMAVCLIFDVNSLFELFG